MSAWVVVPVGMAEIKVSSRPDEVLVAHGVGSCVIVCAWDPGALIGGMAHVVQAHSLPTTAPGNARYADHAVPELLRRMRAAGAEVEAMEVKVAGGASVLQPGPRPGREPLGATNARAVEAILAKYGLKPHASDVGGTHGRTVVLEIATGALRIKTLGQGETVL